MNQRMITPNKSRIWNDSEIKSCVVSFDSGRSIENIAQLYRTSSAIESKLVTLCKIKLIQWYQKK